MPNTITDRATQITELATQAAAQLQAMTSAADEQDKKAATEFLSKEFQLSPALAEKGLDYYLAHQAWHPELEIEMDGLKTVIDIYAEQNGFKGPIPNPEKYVDQSYLRQALRELGLR